MRSTDFIDRSNQRAKYLEKIAGLKANEPKKKVCANHLTSIWLEPYEKCAAGHRWNEDCKELVEEDDEFVSEK